MKTRPRQYAAEVFTSLSAWKRQTRRPVFALIAWTPWSQEPKKSRLPCRSGDDSIGAVLYLQRSRPVCASHATTKPSPGLPLLAHHRVHVGLVYDTPPDGGRRRRAAAEALAPVDQAGLGVEREEEALLLREVHPAVAEGRRELERVMRVDRPQALVGRAVLVGRDVLARVVVAVGRPGPRVLLLRRRLRLRLLGRHELLRGRAALLEWFVLAADVQADHDREDDHEQPASHQQASSSHGAEDGKRRAQAPGGARCAAMCRAQAPGGGRCAAMSSRAGTVG